MATTYAIITGASSGIGYQYARSLGERGYNLLIVSNEESIYTKAAELQEAFPSLHVIGLLSDLSRQESAKELYAYCQKNGLSVEVLVNNAGVYHDRDFLDDSEGFNSLILMLHAYTPAMLCYYFGQDMRQKHKGYILNMCSITSKMYIQRMSTYASTKSFLEAFSRSLHIELRGEGVHVLNVSPGAVNTGLYNIRGWVTRLGKSVGFIVEPEYLARRGVHYLLDTKRHKATIPCLWGVLVAEFVYLLPTSVLRLIRRFGWF